MAPFFSPGRNPFGAPKIHLAAVGTTMTKVAAAVCDGLIVHPLTTEKYLREVTLPITGPLPLNLSALVASADTEEGMKAAIEAVRQQIAFYGSTTAYRGVLQLHGWSDGADELNRLSVSDDDNKWTAMATVIDDPMLHAFAVVAHPDDVAPALRARFGDMVERISFYTPYSTPSGLWERIAAHLRDR